VTAKQKFYTAQMGRQNSGDTTCSGSIKKKKSKRVAPASASKRCIRQHQNGGHGLGRHIKESLRLLMAEAKQYQDFTSDSELVCKEPEFEVSKYICV
jgi:hypothetical protein